MSQKIYKLYMQKLKVDFSALMGSLTRSVGVAIR